MRAPKVTKHTAALLEDLRHAVHGLCAPFACGGTVLPDQPLTLCFKDKTQLPVLRASNAFEQERLLEPLIARCRRRRPTATSPPRSWDAKSSAGISVNSPRTSATSLSEKL